MKPFLIILLILILLGLFIWLGLQITPKPFPAYDAPAAETKTIPLPDNLPAPVQRFYTQLYGNEVPILESAVISGTGKLRINGLTLPARFRFVHQTGQDYRHYIETTFFGQPLLKVNEHFLNGKARLELPFGISEGEKVDQGANLALWAEAIWIPSVWITDLQVRWEAVNENSAILIVPFADEEERFTAQFDPQSGLLTSMESMRYKATDSAEKTLWLNKVVAWEKLGQYLQPVQASVTWMDEGTPWARFTTLEVVYNTDVSTYVQNSGIEK